jgi:hypothetical protein
VDTVKSSVFRGAGEAHPHACYDGWIYLTYAAFDESVGEEVERIEIVRCRRCAISSEDDRYDHDVDELLI